MKNWAVLSEPEYKLSWDFIYDCLQFHPNDENQELIALPFPSRCFDISTYYNDGFREELYEDLHECALKWFKQICDGKRLFALDWQHDCYSFDCYLPFEKDEFGEWLVPVFPNGDYLFFLTNDFRNGVFADGINLKMSFWGEDMMGIVKSIKSDLLEIRI